MDADNGECTPAVRSVIPNGGLMCPSQRPLSGEEQAAKNLELLMQACEAGPFPAPERVPDVDFIPWWKRIGRFVVGWLLRRRKASSAGQ